MRLIRRALFLLRQRREAADLAEEMEIHRQMLEQETGDGNSSRRRMGATMMAQEDARHIWLSAWIESIFQDLRYAWRSLRNQPSFTMLALLALVLAIGLDTSLFTFFNAIAIRPWPVPDPDRVVTLFASSPTRTRPGGFSVAEYRYFREHSRTLSGAFIMRHERVNLDRQAEGARSACHFVTGEYFSALNVEMALGRGFVDDEDHVENPQGVAVLSYRTWQSRYAADPKIVGRRIEVNDVPFTVVGVANEEFLGTAPGPSDLWVPLPALQLALPLDTGWKDFLTSPDQCCSQLAGRMVAGTTHQRVQAELTLLDAQFQAQRREKPQNILVAGTPFLSNPSGKRVAGQVVSLLAAAVGAILLLACANVSNLMLARASARQREIAVRLAIGAGRWRVVRQLLTESLLLASIASVLGLAVAAWLPRFLLTRMAEEAPPFRVTPDGTVLAFSVAITFIVTIAFGLVPALRATQISVGDAMKNHNMLAGGRFPLRSFLLGVQVTISVVLLAAAGLLTRGLVHARQVDPGFQTSGVALVPVDLPTSQYNQARGEAFFTELAERLRPLSASGKVGMSMLAPLGSGRMAEGMQLPGQTSDRPTSVLYYRVNAEFFDALRIPVLTGRNFTPGDTARRVILINDTMARRYWPGQNPLGKWSATMKLSAWFATLN